MSKREGKFNIWIAYSDLFSNLTTFIFISAVGIFAAFGSTNTLNGPGTLAAVRTMCETDINGVGSVLTSPTFSRLAQPVLPNSLRNTVCEGYLQLHGYRFKPKSNSPSALVDRHGAAITRSATDRVCRLLLNAAAQNSLFAHNGQLVIIGTAAATPTQKCPILNYIAVDMSASGLSPKLVQVPIKVPLIQACLQGDPKMLKKHLEICNKVRSCSKTSSLLCQEIFSKINTYESQRKACLPGLATSRAATLNWMCEQAFGHPDFPSETASGSVLPVNATAEDDRNVWLRNVKVIAIGPDDLPGVTFDPDSILIKIEFRPE
jgi:hypothetical protein